MKIHPNTKYFWNALGLCLLVIILGVTIAYFLGIKIESNSRKALLGETTQASLLVNANVLQKISGNQSDLNNPIYLDLKSKFEQFRQEGDNIRFVYIMGYRPDIQKEFFYVDSEDPSSKDYSPPGQVYDQTTQSDINNYLNGAAYTEGPYTDAWGSWISGNVPIKDGTGHVFGMVGLDISTTSWYKDLHLMQFVVASIVFVFCALIIILSFVFYEKHKKFESVSLEKDSLKTSLEQIKAVQILAHIGRIVIKFPEEIISLDQQFSVLFPEMDLERIPKDSFIAKIHKDDQEFFHHMLVEINDQNVSYTWADLRIGDRSSGYRHYHVYGNVQRSPEGILSSFLGVMQDITDIDK